MNFCPRMLQYNTPIGCPIFAQMGTLFFYSRFLVAVHVEKYLATVYPFAGIIVNATDADRYGTAPGRLHDHVCSKYFFLQCCKIFRCNTAAGLNVFENHGLVIKKTHRGSGAPMGTLFGVRRIARYPQRHHAIILLSFDFRL